MELLEQLKREHKEVQDLLEKAEATGEGAKKTREQLAEKIKEKLLPHSKAEEKVLYARLADEEESRDLIVEAKDEHQEAEQLLKELLSTETHAPEWIQTLKKLRDAVAHHVQEEEDETFVKAESTIAPEEMDELLLQYREEKERFTAL